MTHSSVLVRPLRPQENSFWADQDTRPTVKPLLIILTRSVVQFRPTRPDSSYIALLASRRGLSPHPPPTVSTGEHSIRQGSAIAAAIPAVVPMLGKWLCASIFDLRLISRAVCSPKPSANVHVTRVCVTWSTTTAAAAAAFGFSPVECVAVDVCCFVWRRLLTDARK